MKKTELNVKERLESGRLRGRHLGSWVMFEKDGEVVIGCVFVEVETVQGARLYTSAGVVYEDQVAAER